VKLAGTVAYVRARDWHPGGHGQRLHSVGGRSFASRLMREVWGWAIVHIKLIGDLRRLDPPASAGVRSTAPALATPQDRANDEPEEHRHDEPERAAVARDGDERDQG
jgi:hypothetical protein